jgi:hypothetical protein
VTSQRIDESNSGDHDRVGLHREGPAFPHDRLAAALSPEPVFYRRFPVLLAAGVLALSAGSTATSVAAEPDRQQEGLSTPEQVVSPPGETAPDPREHSADPGAGTEEQVGAGPGGETVLPFEVDSRGAGPEAGGPEAGGDETGLLESEPADDPDGRLPVADPVTPDVLNEAPVPPTEAVPPADNPLPPAPLTTGAPAEPPAEDTPGAELGGERPGPQQDGDKPAARRPPQRPKGGDRRQRERAAKSKQPEGPPPAPTPLPAPPEAAALTSETPTPPPVRNARFHVVRRGESLWSIATRLLGPGASAADIALQVHRLWHLNEERIGTGDPNLLIAGVRLRLR